MDFIAHGNKTNIANTSCGASERLIERWLLTCTVAHQTCNYRQEDKQGWLPTRLIDVGKPTADAPSRLIHTAQEGSELRSEKYIALGHRWDSNVTAKLTSANVARYQQEIPLDDLPATFKDTLDLTRRLNVRYV